MEMDKQWIRLALKEAEKAFDVGEVPVGAVLVRNGNAIALAHNLCNTRNDATAHAECLVISAACQSIASWRLQDCTLYVTLEPCPMCMGAAINARIPRIVYAAKDARAGACGSLINLSSYPLEAKPQIEGGVLEDEARGLLQRFFTKLRQKEG